MRRATYLLLFVKLDALAVMILRSWSFSFGRVSPPLRVSSIRFLPSNSLASSTCLDRYIATQNEIGILTHEIGIFPQSVGNIPHLKNLSASFEPLSATLTMLA